MEAEKGRTGTLAAGVVLDVSIQVVLRAKGLGFVAPDPSALVFAVCGSVAAYETPCVLFDVLVETFAGCE